MSISPQHENNLKMGFKRGFSFTKELILVLANCLSYDFFFRAATSHESYLITKTILIGCINASAILIGI